MSTANPVGYPTRYHQTADTSKANRMLKTAGANLRKLAEENTQLHESNMQLTEKVSSAERREQLYKVALSGVEAGTYRLQQVPDVVDRWHREGQSPSYYQNLVDARTNLSFASTAGASDSARTGVDKTSSSVQHTDEGGDARSVAVHDSISAFLRSTGN